MLGDRGERHLRPCMKPAPGTTARFCIDSGNLPCCFQPRRWHALPDNWPADSIERGGWRSSRLLGQQRRVLKNEAKPMGGSGDYSASILLGRFQRTVHHATNSYQIAGYRRYFFRMRLLHPRMRSGGPSLTERVVRVVAREKGMNPLELPGLYRALDGNSLEKLVEELDEGQALVFNYVGKRVTVTGTGSIEITDDTTTSPGTVATVQLRDEPRQ